jgi:hypothetical protein
VTKQAFGFVLSFVILLGIFVSSERFFSPIFKDCLAKHQIQDASSPAKENPPGLLSSVSTYIECTGSFIDANNGAITALATIIIAAFTATLWRATTDQAKLTKEALIADKRAFVFAESLFSYWENGQNGMYNWRFRPVWRNSGDTATKRLEIHTNCELRNSPLADRFDFNYATTNVGGGLLGPKAASNGGVAPNYPFAAITPQDIADVQAGVKFLYLWGFAKYNDVFPGTPRHITRFCWALLPDGNSFTFTPPAPPNLSTLTFTNIHQNQGNCADEECGA